VTRGADRTANVWAANEDALLTVRMQDWCEAVSGGDSARFRLRLAWDGLEPDAARRAVAPVRLRKGAPVPAWGG
jgi:hypothetical protein